MNKFQVAVVWALLLLRQQGDVWSRVWIAVPWLNMASFCGLNITCSVLAINRDRS